MTGGPRRLLGRLSPYFYLSPALASMAVLSFFPISYTVYIAFTNFSLYHFDHYQFVGLANFKEILAGPFKDVFIPVLLWTVVFALLTTLLNFSAGLFLAVLLNNPNMRETNLYRALLIIPWAIPGTIAMLSWTGLLNESYGAINRLLALLHVDPVPWLNEPFWARISLLLVNLWLGFPFMMNVSLGALQAIPHDLYEAAEIDGANWLGKFRHVTLPLLMSFSLPLVISSFAYNFNNFGIAYLLTGGGPPRVDSAFAGYTDNLSSFSYKMTMQFNRYDLASTMSIIIFLVVGTLSLINMNLSRAFKEVD